MQPRPRTTPGAAVLKERGTYPGAGRRRALLAESNEAIQENVEEAEEGQTTLLPYVQYPRHGQYVVHWPDGDGPAKESHSGTHHCIRSQETLLPPRPESIGGEPRIKSNRRSSSLIDFSPLSPCRKRANHPCRRTIASKCFVGTHNFHTSF